TVQPRIEKAIRLANVERLRVLAMLEIVRYHDHGDRLALVGGLGLPTFLLLTNLFNTTLTHKRGPVPFLHDKRARLVVPWLFWSVFYGVWLVRGALRHGQPLRDVLSWQLILAGTSSHLWFVPFAFASAALTAGAQWLTGKLPHRATAYAALALGGVVLVALAGLPGRDYPAPLPQWILSTPSVFLGFGIGRLLLADRGQLQLRAALPAALGAFALLLYCGLVEPSFLMQRYATSLLLVLAVLLVAGKPDPVSQLLSPLLFGIYLVHHFVADHVLSHIPYVADMPWLFIVDFACTIAVVSVLRRTPIARVL
ncbi:MAG: acyltransferase family protein, partial [Polyangiales bacterium]